MEPEPCDLSRLTAAERAVLELIARGFTTAEIAERMGVAESTVRKHVEHILAKLGVRNRREAARAWWTATRGTPSEEARRQALLAFPVTPDHHRPCPSPSRRPGSAELRLLRPTFAARCGEGP